MFYKHWDIWRLVIYKVNRCSLSSISIHLVFLQYALNYFWKWIVALFAQKELQEKYFYLFLPGLNFFKDTSFRKPCHLCDTHLKIQAEKNTNLYKHTIGNIGSVFLGAKQSESWEFLWVSVNLILIIWA